MSRRYCEHMHPEDGYGPCPECEEKYRQPQPEKCVWERFDGIRYAAACGEKFWGIRTPHSFKYCPYCGREIEVKP